MNGSAWALIEEMDLVLMIQRSPGTSRPLQWCLPGGGIEKDELPEEACAREVLEETGLTVRVHRKLQSQNGKHYFHCTLRNKDDLIELAMRECVQYHWAEPRDLLKLGEIMDLRILVKVFAEAGHFIRLTEEAQRFLNGGDLHDPR